jgi:hypothetical protein
MRWTKRGTATFSALVSDRGTCPIGLPGPTGYQTVIYSFPFTEFVKKESEICEGVSK